MCDVLKKASLSAIAAATALSMWGGEANALEYNFGGVQVFLDTTVSAGVSMRVAERNMSFVASGNGGPTSNPTILRVAGPDGTVVTPLSATNNLTLGVGADAGDAGAAPGSSRFSYAGSINADDSRLNFDRGDLTSGVVKMTNDIQANYENYKFFARVSSFYDAVLDDDSSYERSNLIDGGKVDAARDIDLLDFYVSGDFNVGDLPLNVRLGKQVVNWGEATFILNGISSWNPFDVSAFRRPGSEVKEGLVPIWGAYASLGLPYDLSLEAFYQLEWDHVQLDRPGTPFSGSDTIPTGSDGNGNLGGRAWVTGGRSGGGFLNRNCSTPNALSTGFDAAYLAAGQTNYVCGAGGTYAQIDYAIDLPVGQSEFNRLLLRGGTADVGRLEDRDAKDSGQYGVALRWYAEDLNSTEFGFYFMNYHSRLPFASQRLILGSGAANSEVRSYLASEDNNSGTGRGTNAAGCFAPGTLSPALAGIPAGQPGAITAALDPTKLVTLNSRTYNDTLGLNAVGEAVANGGGSTHASAAALGLNALVGGGFAVADGSLLELAITNCLLVGAQTNAATGLLVDGAEILIPTNPNGARESLNLFFEYPEDIKLFGVSFNTTLGDWGVQGEVAFRHDQPLQLDTDQITIATLGASCTLDFLLGPDAMTALQGRQTFSQTSSSCTDAGANSSTEFNGFTREEVVTFDIGTTATYTNSNPLVGALGADIGILLTELGAMYVPDAASEGDFSQSVLQNVCTSGTDLPLGSFLGLSPRTGCRPTEFAYGYVLVGVLQYNNAFGTPITVSPRIAWQHDVKGNSPAPLSNYREGTKSVSLAIDGSYQNTWRGGISYTNIFGNEKYTKDGDKDFVSINLSYSF